MSEHADPAEHIEEAERVRALYAQLPQSAAGALLTALLFVVLFWDHVERPVLLVWTGTLIANSVWRFSLLRGFRAAAPGPDALRAWRDRAFAGMLVSIVLLGAAGILFFVPDHPGLQTALAVSLTVMAAGSVASTAIYLPIAYIAVLVLLMPLMARFAISGGTDERLVSLVLLISLPVVFRFGQAFSRNFGALLRAQAENARLIEDLRNENAAVREARSAAESASVAKTRFFAAASHDLRQPVHALALFAAALQEKSREPEVAHVVNSINASVAALEGLFNELLDMSKIDAGAITANPAHFAVQSVFERLRLDFEPEAFEKGLGLRIHATGLHAYSDAVLVERILRNLVANAIRYTEEGGILVGCRLRGDRIWLEVRDTGIGIRPEDQARVFDEFHQIESPRAARTKGLGLGLAIVKRLAGILETRVELVSTPGRGSLFRLAIPRGRAPIPSSSGIPAPSGPAARLDDRMIVVVEDEAAVVEGMRVLLDGWGARVRVAESAEAALTLLADLEAAPDLVIADYRLGTGMTGVDVIEHFRERFGRGLPAIVVTGSTTPAHLEQARERDFHLLLKPVSPAKLRTLIHFKLKGSGA